MKVFITAPYRGTDNKAEIEHLCSIVKSAGFEDYCFVRDFEHFQKVFTDPKEIMQKASEEIIKCDVLLFDASEKSTIRAVELGIAYSNHKKLIVIVREGTVIKETLRGIADALITYKEIADIQQDLGRLFQEWTK